MATDIRDVRHPLHDRLQSMGSDLRAWVAFCFKNAHQANPQRSNRKSRLLAKVKRDWDSVTQAEEDELYEYMDEELIADLDEDEYRDYRRASDGTRAKFLQLVQYRRETRLYPQDALRYGLSRRSRERISRRRSLEEWMLRLDDCARSRLRSPPVRAETAVANSSGRTLDLQRRTSNSLAAHTNRATTGPLEARSRDRDLAVDLMRKYNRQVGELDITQRRLEEIRLTIPNHRHGASDPTWNISDFHHRDRKLATDLIRKFNRQTFEAELTKSRLQELGIDVVDDPHGRILELEQATQRLTFG